MKTIERGVLAVLWVIPTLIAFRWSVANSRGDVPLVLHLLVAVIAWPFMAAYWLLDQLAHLLLRLVT